jgi:hypothetical protein
MLKMKLNIVSNALSIFVLQAIVAPVVFPESEQGPSQKIMYIDKCERGSENTTVLTK